MAPKQDQEHVMTILSDTVTLLCQTGFTFKTTLSISALIAITLDHDDVVVVDIRETLNKTVSDVETHNSENESKQTSLKRKRKRISRGKSPVDSDTEDGARPDTEQNSMASLFPNQTGMVDHITGKPAAEDASVDNVIHIKDEPGESEGDRIDECKKQVDSNLKYSNQQPPPGDILGIVSENVSDNVMHINDEPGRSVGDTSDIYGKQEDSNPKCSKQQHPHVEILGLIRQAFRDEESHMSDNVSNTMPLKQKRKRMSQIQKNKKNETDAKSDTEQNSMALLLASLTSMDNVSRKPAADVIHINDEPSESGGDTIDGYRNQADSNHKYASQIPGDISGITGHPEHSKPALSKQIAGPSTSVADSVSQQIPGVAAGRPHTNVLSQQAAALPMQGESAQAALGLHGRYKCEYCDKNFSSKQNLKLHVNSIHHGIFRHPCPKPYCLRGFNKKIYLNAHLVKHHGLGKASGF